MQQRRKLNEISDAVLCAMKALEAILYSLQQQTVRKIKENLYRDTVTTAEHWEYFYTALVLWIFLAL